MSESMSKSAEAGYNPQSCRGDLGGSAPQTPNVGDVGGGARETTSIDLRKPADLNLVYRSVLNGWDVPQQTRDEISDQLIRAMDFHSEHSNQGDLRATSRVIKLCKLMLLMDVRNDVEAGLRKSIHPIGRKRGPEKRSPRRLSTRDYAKELERALHRLAEMNPGLAVELRAKMNT